MSNAPPQQLNTREKITVTVEVKQQDGTTVDPTSPLTLIQPSPAIAVMTIDPTDNRKVIIEGTAPGNATGSIGAQGVPGAADCDVPLTVVAAPNLARVDFVSATLPEPK